MVVPIESEPVSPPLRDTVSAVETDGDDPPAIVSISDIHGYLEDARQALLTLTEHPDYDPVVKADGTGTLHWADENYVLLFNGDLVDRGPNNEVVFEMVARLIEEAPPGRVRITLGNHEWMIMLPEKYQLVDWYSTTVSQDKRRDFLQWIADRHVVAAYDGHHHTYAHAGSPTPYDVSTVNDSLMEAAAELQSVIGTPRDSSMQAELPEQYPTILGTGDRGAKGPTAGLVWIKFDHLEPDSPAQIVGHTRQSEPQSMGGVHCQDLILKNQDTPGGHGVFVETPESLTALLRDSNQTVTTEALV